MVLAIAIFSICVLTTTHLFGVTIQLDDPRPDIVRFSSNVGLVFSVDDAVLDRPYGISEVINKSGRVEANPVELALDSWRFDMSEAQTAARVPVADKEFRIAMSSGPWGGSLDDRYVSALAPSRPDDPFFHQVLNPPPISAFDFRPITGTWTITGPTEIMSGPLELSLMDARVIGGTYVDLASYGRLVDIGFYSESPPLFQGIVDGVPIKLSGTISLSIIVAPESFPSAIFVSGIIWIICMMQRTRRNSYHNGV
jgi:hypothetical protein